MSNDILGAALLLRLGVDASGLAAEVSSKLTAVERTAVASGNRISANVATNSTKVQAATLRVVAAQERYNRLLVKEGATQGSRASAQASLITSRATLARETDKAAAATGRLDKGTASLGSRAKTVAAGFAGFAAFSFLKTGLTEVKEFQTGLAQSEAGIKSTGGAANVTAKDIDELGSSIQRYSGFQDDDVIAGENLLLTFKKVHNEVGEGNDIFDRATIAGADLAARGFGTMETASKQLGKALNEPTRGVTALARAGITFDDAQRKNIKSLVQSGQLLEAQKIILKEVETEVGGSAKAYGDTLPGAIDRSQRAMEDFGQATIGALAPAIESLAGVATFFASHETARNALLWGGGIAGGLLIAAKAVKAYQDISILVFRRVPAQIAANAALAASYEGVAVAASGAALAEGAAGGGGGIGGRGLGRLGAGKLGLLGLTVGATAAGASGALGGASPFATIGGATATGALIGSAVPGVGTAIGAGVGAAAGIGLSIVGASQNKTPTTTNRTPAQIKADIAGVSAEYKKAQVAAQAYTGTLAGNTALQRMNALGEKGGKLTDELKVAQAQAKQTFDTFDASTGKVEKLTSAQIAAAGAADVHSAALKREKDAHKALRESFAVDPFSGTPDDEKAVGPKAALKRLQDTAAAQVQARKDLRKLTRGGASTEEIDALRGLETSAPGTIHRIATSDSGKYAKEFAKGLRSLKHSTSVLANLYEGSDTLAEKRARRDARAYNRAFAAEVNKTAIDFFTNGPAPVPGVSAPSAFPANKHGVNTRRRTP